MDSWMETSAVFAAALLSEAELQKESCMDDFPHSSYKKRDYKAIS